MGQKITDRSELATTPASGDLLHIVDVSDTTDSAQGTSKKIQYSNLVPTISSASTTTSGTVELATTAETETGTDATRAVTPDGLHDMTTLAGAAWFLDEDTMSSDSATKVPSQQSVKAYSDRTVNTFLNVHPLYAPQGFPINCKISVTDTGTGLAVALKTLSGSDPSSTDPIHVRLAGAIRTITSALSVTIADGANSFNAGSAEFATKEVDYFTVLIWDTVGSAVRLGTTRYPGGSIYSDYSSTATNEKYLAISGGTPAATDEIAIIGRYAATLSAGAGYTWSVPTFTAINLIQRPIYETRALSWAPTYSASGSMTFTSVSNTLAEYKITRDTMNLFLRAAGTTGGTASTTILYTLPFSSASAYYTFPSMYADTTFTGGGYSYLNSVSQGATEKNTATNWGLGASRRFDVRMSYQI